MINKIMKFIVVFMFFFSSFSSFASIDVSGDIKNEFEPAAWSTETIVLTPNAQGSTSEWSGIPNVGSDHYLNVDETPTHDGDSSYLYSSSYSSDEWEFTNPSGYTEPIGNVKVHLTGKVSDTSYHFGCNLNGEFSNIEINTLGYEEDTDIWYECPWTGEPWTWTDVNDITVEVHRNAGTYNAYVTQCYVEVTYITSSLSTFTIRPDGDDTTYWDAYPDGAHYLNIDEGVADDDSTYVYSDYGYDKYTMTDSTGQTGNIYSITAYARMKDAGGASSVRVRWGDTYDFSETYDPTTSWETYSYSNRHIGSHGAETDFTWDYVDNLIFTLQRDDGTIYATQCYLTIKYYDETIPSEVYVDDNYDSSTTGWQDTHFDNINDAYNRVLNGGTIYVYEGIYSSSVDVEKNVDFIATDATMHGTISIGQSELTVNISGFTFESMGKIFGDSTWDSYISIYNNTFDNCDEAINLTMTDNTEIYNNEFIDNNKGIVLDYYCYYTDVHDNNFTTNGYGIWYADYFDDFPGDYHGDSYDGTFIHNNFFSNTIQIYDCSSPVTNTYSQNYYNDYTGVDTGMDGIGDTPYDIPGGSHQDSSPLMNPWTGSLPSPSETVTNINTSTTYTTIQNAVDDATAGDWILIGNRTYYENIVVDKTLTFIGEDYITTILDGLGSYSFNLQAEDITIKNLTLANGGIYLDESDGAYFTRNLFQNSEIDYNSADYTTFFENNFTDSTVIEILDYSAWNVFYWNNFYSDSTIRYDPPVTPDDPENFFNNTYPLGGNYWEDHWNTTDEYCGPNQDIPGSDGITDYEYNAGRGAVDFYPLLEPVIFGLSPPVFSNEQPASGTTNIPINTNSVSIDISDESSIDWTIEGKYIQDTGGTNTGSGTKTASLVSDIPYGTRVIWYVNATDGESSSAGVYSFTMEYYTSANTYVDNSYHEGTSGYGETYFDSIQTAIHSTENGGTIHIASGTYYENLRIDKPIVLSGENKENTIIQGAKKNPPPYDAGPGYTIHILDDGVDDTLKIENLTIYNEWDGLLQTTCIMFDSSGIPWSGDMEHFIINNCIINHGAWGILIDPDTVDVKVINCNFDCTDVDQCGLGVIGENIEVKQCTFNGDGISGAVAGIMIYNLADNVWIYDNYFDNLVHGIKIWDGENIKINGNTIRNSEEYGIKVTRAYDTFIYNNNFYDNNPFPFDSPQVSQEFECDGLYWNASYPDGGNYYNDFDENSEGAMDIYRGPNQEIPGIDGIVDDYHCLNPYDVDGPAGAQDFYPLMEPYEPVELMSVDFTWDPEIPLVDEWVHFTALTDDALSYEWDFGDGNEAEGQDPHHQYEEVGEYSVKLTTRGKYGYVDISTQTIYVIPSNPFIIPPRVAKYPGYTVPEMYNLMRTDKLPVSNSDVSVMVIDSGIRQGEYQNFSLSDEIESLHHPSYQDSDDGYGHGTFVNYEVGYILKEKLPKSTQYSYKAFGTNGETSLDILLEALDEAKNKNVDVVSLSAGALGNPNDALSRKVEELRNEGIIVICAAGNFGPKSSTVLSPACSDYSFSVAGSDPGWYTEELTETRRVGVLNLADDTLATWSSRGPVPKVYPKPDATAPGESILGPWSSAYQKGIIETNQSGTSMATPLVAGGTAVIIAHNKGTIDIIKTLRFWDKGSIVTAYEDAVRESCYKKGGVDGWGAGIVQMDVINNQFQSNLQDLFLLTVLEVIIVPISIIASIFIFIRWRTGSWNPFSKKPWYAS